MPEVLKKYLIWPVLSIVIFLVLAELLLRLTGVDPHPKGLDFTVNHALDFPEVFDKDKELFWRMRPDQTVTSQFFEGKTYRINRQGFRGDDFRPAKTGLRVAVLGNSCSFGWGVATERTFAFLLQEKLRQLPGLQTAEVYNFSVPGYTSFQGERNYRLAVRPYRPDILLVTFGWNDQWLSANQRPDKNQKMPPQIIINAYNFLGRSRFYRFYKSLLFSVAPRLDSLRFRTDLTRVSLADFKENLGRIIRSAQTDGTAVILLTSPSPAVPPVPGTAFNQLVQEIHFSYNQMTRESAAWYSVGLVDLAGIFDRSGNLFDDPLRDPFHYNRHGHALAADEIFRFLREGDYLQVHPTAPPGSAGQPPR